MVKKKEKTNLTPWIKHYKILLHKVSQLFPSSLDHLATWAQSWEASLQRNRQRSPNLRWWNTDLLLAVLMSTALLLARKPTGSRDTTRRMWKLPVINHLSIKSSRRRHFLPARNLSNISLLALPILRIMCPGPMNPSKPNRSWSTSRWQAVMIIDEVCIKIHYHDKNLLNLTGLHRIMWILFLTSNSLTLHQDN